MERNIWLWFILALVTLTLGQSTVYEYYRGDGISSGLVDPAEGFVLNGKPIKIFSGAIHYFRVHPSQWRDRLKKARAAGLIAVETYVPWNLHEIYKDVFDFGDGDNDMSAFLDVVSFIKMAQEEDLLVILRPGPYICGEWEFGGLPSWLLRDPDMKVRSSYVGFTDRMSKFYNRLMPLVRDLQFTKGGPIIMFQIENEYGAYAGGTDKVYMNLIRKLMLDNGIEELFITCGNIASIGLAGYLDGVTMAANFGKNPEEELGRLKKLQPDRPLMVMEYWTGWYTHWMDPSNANISVELFADNLETILQMNSSVNFYMFLGGTSFGFMNGANFGIRPSFLSDVTSYDYDSPLTEFGDYTEKYQRMREMLSRYSTVDFLTPEMPEENPKKAYGVVDMVEYIPYQDMIKQIRVEDQVESDSVMATEYLDVNNGSGQNFGYTLYRTRSTVNNGSVIKIWGHVRDIAILLVNGRRRTPAFLQENDIYGFGYYGAQDQEFILEESEPGEKTLDIFVENWSRINYGEPFHLNFQRKGLPGGRVDLDGSQLNKWEISALEMKSSWIKSLTGWLPYSDVDVDGPGLWRGILTIEGTPQDTFLETENWTKGVAFVNGFNLGRFFHLGPQRTLYVPGPVLKQGDNEVIIFEQYTASNTVNFVDSHRWN